MRILLILALCIIATSCTGGGNNYIPITPIQRLLLISYTSETNGIDLTVSGTNSGSFPAVTYYIYGTDSDLGDQTMIPLLRERLNEQAFGPFAHGDAPQEIDLTPWEDYTAIYLRALLVTPNRGWKLEPGMVYEFSTN